MNLLNMGDVTEEQIGETSDHPDATRTLTPGVLSRIELVRKRVGETTSQEIILENPKVKRLENDLPREAREKLARLYTAEWSREGIPITEETTLKLFEQLDLSETFVVQDAEGDILAMVNTVPVKAESLKDLMKRFPTYRSIEEESARQKANPANKPMEPNFKICFSIVARKDNGAHIRIQNGTGTYSLSRFLLQSVPLNGAYKIAFSRMSGIRPDMDATRHFLASSDKRDATSMHETFGGTVVAVVEGSRPEDANAGGANTWIIYAEDARVAPNPKPKVIETIPTANGGEIRILDNYCKIVL